METKKESAPDKVFHCGSVRAAIWVDSKVHKNAIVELHSIKFNRCYQEDKDDKADKEWKYTNTFNVEDLPKLALVATEAYKLIRLRLPEQNKTSTSESDSN